MDIYGVVNNVVFLRYLEEARVDLLNQMAPTGGDAFFTDGSVVVSHSIDYLRRLTHRPEPVDIEMWVTEVHSATVRIEYRIMDASGVYARAATVMAPFDFASGRPRRITEAETAFFEKYLEEPSYRPR